jgi:Spy/CpxP family protein refolding chaperone
MKKVILVAAILSSLVVYSAFAEQGMNGSMHNNTAARDVMYHINPMPNYMKVIMMHGDELDLSEKQQADLAEWREKTRPVMSNLKKMTIQAENKLRSMSLNNASEEELLVQYAEIEEFRHKIAETKIKCRSNMKNILTDEQFAKVQEIYTENLLAKHAN